MRARAARSLVFLLAVLGTATSPAGAIELTAVVTRLEGTVTVGEAAPAHGRGATLPVVRRAHYLQIVGEGDELHVPPAAVAGLVCSTDRWVELAGGGYVRLTEALCRAGRPLAAGIYHRLAPAAGRMRSLKGVLVLEGATRGDEAAGHAVPVLVSPRNTAILAGRPEITWTEVPGASEYLVELTGPTRFAMVLDAARVACGERRHGLALCSTAYPADAGDLPAGTLSFLGVGARSDFTARFRQEAEPGRIERMRDDRAKVLGARLERLQALPLDTATRRLLEAELYAGQGLFAEAIAAYRQTLALVDSPEVRITLGDAYLATGLLRMAARTYHEALDSSPRGVIRGAAAMGLGRIEQARTNFTGAAEQFDRAREAFAALGLARHAAQAKRAQRAMLAAARRRPASPSR